MANIERSDETKVLNFFHSDSKDVNTFDGFNPAVHNLEDVELLIYVSLMDFVPRNDQEFDADLEVGWSRVGPPLLRATIVVFPRASYLRFPQASF